MGKSTKPACDARGQSHPGIHVHCDRPSDHADEHYDGHVQWTWPKDAPAEHGRMWRRDEHPYSDTVR